MSPVHWAAMLPSSGQGEQSPHTGCWGATLWEKELQGPLGGPMLFHLVATEQISERTGLGMETSPRSSREPLKIWHVLFCFSIGERSR